ncbi:hypothetical protein Taro_050930 [Colocasia esculenta]|uniref:Uncharacterized protein n=1 Tax=Colocasia esculenta TaxID=4460 RepID=A0A843XEN7_COLES|nr:hypothetical protein [Colocasia esculenta]
MPPNGSFVPPPPNTRGEVPNRNGNLTARNDPQRHRTASVTSLQDICSEVAPKGFRAGSLAYRTVVTAPGHDLPHQGAWAAWQPNGRRSLNSSRYARAPRRLLRHDLPNVAHAGLATNAYKSTGTVPPPPPAARSVCFPAILRMEDPNASSPIASSLAGVGSGVAPADDSLLAADSSPHIGSAHGSYQNEGLLSAASGTAGDGGNAGGSDTERLTHFDAEAFVEEVLVKDAEWYPGAIEKLVGSYVFVCSHGSRDKRCGVCGPTLIKRFKEEIEERCLQGQVTVSACSHIGGHKYAGNVIIFRPTVDGVTGHWYGYVSPDDVPLLLDQHIGKGEVVTHLWRGQMGGLSEDEQKEVLELNVQQDGKAERKGRAEASSQSDEALSGGGGCCQGAGNFTCCQNAPAEGKPECIRPEQPKTENNNRESNTCSSKGPGARKNCRLPTWFERWEREDTYAALAVAAAVVSVAVAYSFYRQTR